jgi:hypothetical protein
MILVVNAASQYTIGRFASTLNSHQSQIGLFRILTGATSNARMGISRDAMDRDTA